jgi:hypothetical protein
MSLTDHTDTPPGSGWLVDLNEQQKQNLVGAMVNVFWNLKATTGLLVNIEDGTAFLFRADQAGFIEYQVSGTRYERVPGHPMRPALAHALVYQRAWDEQYEALTNGHGDALNILDYDKARGEWEQRLATVYEPLMAEAADLLFQNPSEPSEAAR